MGKITKSLVVGMSLFTVVCFTACGGGNNASTQSSTQTTKSEKKDVPQEFKNAAIKAKIYGETMSMSKKGIYQQLTSPAGEKFSAEAAQYAIDNTKIDYKKNALEKAKTYQSQMAMSRADIMTQLTSPAGEQFTQDEAQYAMENLPK